MPETHRARSASAKSNPAGRRLTLRQKLLRVRRVDGKHFFVVLGYQTRRVPLISKYLRLRDRLFELSQKSKTAEPRKITGRKSRAVQVPAPYYMKRSRAPRLSVEEVCAELARYDVISLDIFDTALYRAVEKPNDVFRIMGAQSGIGKYQSIRKSAESRARALNNRLYSTREVTLHDIYDVMADRHGIDPELEYVEEQLEIDLSRANPYVKEIYDRLVALGKIIVFMSDMYLPRATLQAMLAKAGYVEYDKLYLSNEYRRRKGDGTLQRILLDDYGREFSVVHLGDVFAADVEKSIAAGLPAIYNPDQRALIREKDMDSLAGSFYGAVINNSIGSGSWEASPWYTHGFRVGGILTLGYCEYIEQLVRGKSIDKVLFLGRDCEVIARVFANSSNGIASEYVDISRFAILSLTLDRNFDDYIGRSILRWFNESNNTRTISQLLRETGFDYLVPYLDDADLEQFQFPASANRRRLEDFLWDHRSIVEDHNSASREAAKEYFSQAVGDSKKILVVDIGWSGTCISELRHFLKSIDPDGAPEVFGALMGTSREEHLTDAISQGLISSFIYSPLANMDITRYIKPGGALPVETRDLLSHPLEYLFTEAKATTTGYGFDETGRAVAIRGSNVPTNPDQIADMQRGIEDFVAAYRDYSAAFSGMRPISAYVAFSPFLASLGEYEYLREIYGDFLYDAAPVLFGDVSIFRRFGELIPVNPGMANRSEGKLAKVSMAAPIRESEGVILFVSSEMTYTGAPHSLLRMCKVALSLGYEPIVWTAKPGPFAREFEDLGILVSTVPAVAVDAARIDDLSRRGVRLVVCNTVVTDAYVSALEGRFPLVWYVREATNIPDFIRTDGDRAQTLRRSRSIAVVSEYAAAAVGKFAQGPIAVVANAVEDVSDYALAYQYASGHKFEFVQLGTIEHRKGFDLFVAAFKAMPKQYRDRAELHFAGGFINSGTSFSSYLFGQIADEPAITFHGLITSDRAKIELLSQMDAVVVASRDESCSLVALEGTMLGKPLIVTENVGAKYMVSDTNGIVVESGSVNALSAAFMQMMDRDEAAVLAMGTVSRQKYEQLASMEVYRQRLAELFVNTIAAGPQPLADLHRGIGRSPRISVAVAKEQQTQQELIVSLTSFPARIGTAVQCIDSLLAQSKMPDKIILWLASDRFPRGEDDLPGDLRDRLGGRFQIGWVDEDLGPHTKYHYAVQQYPDSPVVILDDDAVYNEKLVEYLHEGYLENDRAVICDRGNLILFRPDGTLRTYDSWVYDYRYLRGMETYQLLATGVGGILLPPGSLPTAAFDVPALKKTSLFADDLWLKAMTTANGYPVWMPRQPAGGYETIEEAQAVALWRANAFQGKNDIALELILEHVEHEFGQRDSLLRRIRGVRDDGQFVGPRDVLDTSPLF